MHSFTIVLIIILMIALQAHFSGKIHWQGIGRIRWSQRNQSKTPSWKRWRSGLRFSAWRSIRTSWLWWQKRGTWKTGFETLAGNCNYYGLYFYHICLYFYRICLYFYHIDYFSPLTVTVYFRSCGTCSKAIVIIIRCILDQSLILWPKLLYKWATGV